MIFSSVKINSLFNREKTVESVLDSCNFAKTILMLFVIFYHSCVFWRGDWFTVVEPSFHSKTISIIGAYFDTFQLPTFVLISGYLYSYLRKKKSAYSNYLFFVKNKAYRLLLPYVVVSIFWILPFTILLSPCCSFLDYFEKFVLCGSADQLWFLIMLFDVFIIFRILERYIANWWGGVILVILYILGWILQYKFGWNYFQISRSIQYLLYFGVGFFWNRVNLSYGFTRVLWRKKTIFTALILHMLLYVFLIIFPRYSNLFRSILGLFGAVVAFPLLVSIRQSMSIKHVGVCEKYNFTMYLYHQQLIYISILVFNGLICAPINVIVNYLIAISGSLLISKFIYSCNILKKLHGIK